MRYQIDEPQVMMVKEDAETIRKIKEVTSEGHDAEAKDYTYQMHRFGFFNFSGLFVSCICRLVYPINTV